MLRKKERCTVRFLTGKFWCRPSVKVNDFDQSSRPGFVVERLQVGISEVGSFLLINPDHLDQFTTRLVPVGLVNTYSSRGGLLRVGTSSGLDWRYGIGGT